MIYLNKNKSMIDAMEKMRMLQTLNFHVRSSTQLVENVTISVGNSPEDYTGYYLYLDVLAIDNSAAYSKFIKVGAVGGVFQINLTTAELGNISTTECDCREMRLRKVKSGISYDIAVAKLTIETIDDSIDTSVITYGTVNVFNHAGTEGAKFVITTADNRSARPVSVVRVSDGLEITGGVSIKTSTNTITIDLNEDFAVQVIYITY